MLVHLVYYSENNIDMAKALASFQEIHRISRRNNQPRSITGALVCDEQWFVQVLEGPRAAVWETFERISDDERHSGVVLCEMTEIAERTFGDWSMGLAIRSGRTELAFRPYLREGRFDPRVLRSLEMRSLARSVAGAA